MDNFELIGIPSFKKGSGIHIKKENRGKFTASAKAAGKSVQEHATDVLDNPNSTPLQKKRALFAKNAKKFKHEEGSKIHKPTGHNLDKVVGNGWVAERTKDMKKKHRKGDGISVRSLGGIIGFV